MEFGEWILRNLGIYDNGRRLDRIAVYFEQEDVLDDSAEMLGLLSETIAGGHESGCDFGLGCRIARLLYEAAIRRAVEEYGVSEDDFDIDVSAYDYTMLSFRNVRVSNWCELVSEIVRERDCAYKHIKDVLGVEVEEKVRACVADLDKMDATRWSQEYMEIQDEQEDNPTQENIQKYVIWTLATDIVGTSIDFAEDVLWAGDVLSAE